MTEHTSHCFIPEYQKGSFQRGGGYNSRVIYRGISKLMYLDFGVMKNEKFQVSKDVERDGRDCGVGLGLGVVQNQTDTVRKFGGQDKKGSGKRCIVVSTEKFQSK